MPAKDEKLKAAAQVTAETLRHAATADWWAEREYMLKARGGELTISELHEKTGTVTQRAFHVGVQVLIDIAKHAPTANERRRAAAKLVDLHVDEMELKLRFLEAYKIVEFGEEPAKPKQISEDEPAEVLPAVPEMTREQLTELIQLRRKQGRSRTAP